METFATFETFGVPKPARLRNSDTLKDKVFDHFLSRFWVGILPVRPLSPKKWQKIPISERLQDAP